MVRIIAQGSGDELVLSASDHTNAVALARRGADPDISDPSRVCHSEVEPDKNKIQLPKGHEMKRSLIVFAGAMLLLAGCSGAEESPESAPTDESTDDAETGEPTFEDMLACMQAGGLDATDQSSSTGANIGVDYPGGRLLVTFEESEEDAETYASVAESQDPTSTVVHSGTIVISSPDDPAAEVGLGITEDCLETA